MRAPPLGRGLLLGLSVLAPASAGPGAGRPAAFAPPAAAVELFGALSASSAGGLGGAGGVNSSNLTDPLATKIASKREELQNETLRIERALSALAKADSSLRVEESEAEHLRADVANASAKVDTVRQEAARAGARLAGLQHADDRKVGPVAVWIAELPHQQGIALILGIVGFLSVLGPSEFTQGLLAILGSCVGAAMVAGCVSSFHEGLPWYSSTRLLLAGSGHVLGYCVWAVLAALGILRWLLGFNCALYACVDEVELDGAGRVVRSGTNLRKPLLAGEASG